MSNTVVSAVTGIVDDLLVGGAGTTMSDTVVSAVTGTVDDLVVGGGLSLEAKLFIGVGVVGVINNGFVVVVIMSSKSMRSGLVNLFIINQSMIDLLTSVFMMVNYPTSMNYVMVVGGLGGEFICRLWMSKLSVWSLFMSSSYNLMALTVERCMEISYPFIHMKYFTRRRMYLLIVAIWVIGPVYNLFIIPTTSEVKDGLCMLGTIWPSHTAKMASGIFTFILKYAIIIIVIIICYVKMALSLKKRVSPADTTSGMISVAEQSRAERMIKARNNVLKTMVIVSVVYVFCWTWNQVYILLFNLGVDVNLQNAGLYYTGIILAFLNTVINPFIYTARYKQFQKAARKLFYGHQQEMEIISQH